MIHHEDYLTRPGRTARFARRQAVRKHNGLCGGVVWTQVWLSQVALAQTASPEAKALAHRLLEQTWDLGRALKNRDPVWEKASLDEVAEERMREEKTR